MGQPPSIGRAVVAVGAEGEAALRLISPLPAVTEGQWIAGRRHLAVSIVHIVDGASAA